MRRRRLVDHATVPKMIRIAVSQKQVRHYRMPVYDLLARQPGIDLTIFCDAERNAPELREEPAAYAFNVVHMPPKRIPVIPGGLMRHAAHRQATDPDRFDLAIMPWDLHYVPTLWPALKRARRGGVKTVLWGHGYSKTSGPRTTAWRNGLARRADGVLLYSHDVADRLRASKAIEPARIFVAQNTLDQTPIMRAAASWRARPGELEAFQRKHGLQDGPTAVYVSRLLAENRIDLLIEGLALVVKQRPDAKLAIVGDGSVRGDLEALAERLGVADRVIFAGAIFDEDELAPWMISAKACAYPVNIGLSLMHAMGYGLPVVTSDRIIDHGPEIKALRDGENGLLYAHDDVGDFARQWLRVIGNDTFQASLSAEALRTMTGQYTLANMVQGFLDATSLVDGETRTVTAPDSKAV